MRTARPLPYGEVSVGGLSDRDLPWQRPPGQRPCPRQTFPWTKTLLLDRDYPPGQRLHSWTETPLLDRDPPGQRSPRRNMGPGTKTGPGSQTDRKWHQRLPPPPPWTEWHMLLKILPCPKLRLRAVKIFLLILKASVISVLYGWRALDKDILIAGSLESANSSILTPRRLFKEVAGKKSGFYVN